MRDMKKKLNPRNSVSDFYLFFTYEDIFLDNATLQCILIYANIAHFPQ